jgi:hypothetical protein
MIYQSRRWRLWSRAVTLALTTLLMFLFAGPVTYALQSDSPRQISEPNQLADRKRPVEGAFIDARGTPDLGRTVANSELLATQYWIPLHGYGNRLFVRTDDPLLLLPNKPNPVTGFADYGEQIYSGKVLPLKGHLSEEMLAEFEARGLSVDVETALFISEGERPSTYRPMVPVVPFVAWAWLVALVGLVQIARGRRTRVSQQTILRET